MGRWHPRRHRGAGGARACSAGSAQRARCAPAHIRSSPLPRSSRTRPCHLDRGHGAEGSAGRRSRRHERPRGGGGGRRPPRRGRDGAGTARRDQSWTRRGRVPAGRHGTDGSGGSLPRPARRDRGGAAPARGGPDRSSRPRRSVSGRPVGGSGPPPRRAGSSPSCGTPRSWCARTRRPNGRPTGGREPVRRGTGLDRLVRRHLVDGCGGPDQRSRRVHRGSDRGRRRTGGAAHRRRRCGDRGGAAGDGRGVGVDSPVVGPPVPECGRSM